MIFLKILKFSVNDYFTTIPKTIQQYNQRLPNPNYITIILKKYADI